jgi:hypothetical protein
MTQKFIRPRMALAAAVVAVSLAGIPFTGLAAVINLTDVTIDGNAVTPGGEGSLTGTTGGTAVFSRNNLQTSGSGVFDPFLTVQADGTEQGYNTDGTLTMDTKRAGFTRNLQVGELKIVTISSQGVTPFYEFILDANQNANDVSGKAVLGLSRLALFTSPTADISEPSLAALDANGDTTLRFDLGTSHTVLIDAALGATAGSGSADMFAYIPVSAFAGALPTDYLYFYNANGSIRESNDGFEEWSALVGVNITNVPEGGATVALFGLALGCMGLMKKRFGKA